MPWFVPKNIKRLNTDSWQLIFELAWMAFGQREYLKAAELFIKMTTANNWSHATYLYIAAGEMKETIG